MGVALLLLVSRWACFSRQRLDSSYERHDVWSSLFDGNMMRNSHLLRLAWECGGCCALWHGDKNLMVQVEYWGDCHDGRKLCGDSPGLRKRFPGLDSKCHDI